MAIKDAPTCEQLGRVVSRLSTPTTIEYKGEKIRISARGQTQETLIKGELGKLPAGLVFVPN